MQWSHWNKFLSRPRKTPHRKKLSLGKLLYDSQLLHKVSGEQYLPKTAIAGCTIGLWKKWTTKNSVNIFCGTRLEIRVLDQLGKSGRWWGNNFPMQIFLKYYTWDYLVTDTAVQQVPRAVERLLTRDLSGYLMCPQNKCPIVYVWG